MVQLKTFSDDKWWLIVGPEFTKEELKPLEENMKRAGVAILEDGERVNVPYANKYSKEQVLQALQSC